MALIKPADTTTPNSDVTNLPIYTARSPVTLPSASRFEGGLIFVTDEGGQPVGSPPFGSPELGAIAFSDGTNWINTTTGVAVGADS